MAGAFHRQSIYNTRSTNKKWGSITKRGALEVFPRYVASAERYMEGMDIIKKPKQITDGRWTRYTDAVDAVIAGVAADDHGDGGTPPIKKRVLAADALQRVNIYACKVRTGKQQRLMACYHREPPTPVGGVHGNGRRYSANGSCLIVPKS